MKIPVDEGLDEPVLNLTPMIDVVFLLLIFFMVTTTFLEPEEALEVDLPTAASGGAHEAPTEEIVVTVLADGRTWCAGTEVSEEQLRALLERAARNDPETPVTIRGHRKASHEAIVAVMDACGLAGLTRLSVGTADDERS